MDKVLQQFENFKIQLEEIISATGNFDDKNCIGVGGFGKVYKGEVTYSEGRSMVAIKRLDPKHGQGTSEFMKEITTLSRYKYENLISLLGFCYEGHEMILVYKHASHGSLDCHLNSPHLMWSQRLKICLDAAKGLSYLHDPRETHQRLIHCDIKSTNILLDDQWNAKVSDFGLSILGPANEQHSLIVTLVAGTPGYCDPQYALTHTLTKESDVYSFGVVLFEVLCGTLCCTYSNGRFQQTLVLMWIESYKHKKLNNIIFKNPSLQPLDHSALETFSDIAYRCLKESREDRPMMSEVVTELETALESQEFSGWKAPLSYNEEIINTAEPPLHYRSKVELRTLLSKGVLLNGGKTFDGFDRSKAFIEVDGEFRPLEKVEHNEDEKLDMQPISGSDANWEEKLPVDYEDLMKRSKNRMPWTTKNELYAILCKGFLINDGEEWFSLDKYGKKCHMLSAKAACGRHLHRNLLVSSPDSRFFYLFLPVFVYI